MMPEPQTIGPVERALWWRAAAPFTQVPPPLVAELARRSREEVVRSGGIVGPAGGRARRVQLLAEGRLVARDGRGGSAELGAPQVIGLIELLAGAAPRGALMADGEATILSIDGGALLDLLEDEFTLVTQVRQALGRCLAAWQRARGDWRPEAPLASDDAAPADLSRFVDRLLALQRAPLLRDFGVAVLATVLREEIAERHPAGAALFAAGDRAERILLIGAGTVVATGPDGRELELGAGHLLGDNDALLGAPHAYGAVCATPATLIALDPQAIWDAAEDHAHVARALLRSAARQLLRLQPTAIATFEAPNASPPAAGQEESC